MRLTSAVVEDIFRDCLFRDEEVINRIPVKKPVSVDGMLCRVHFHPDRVLKNKQTINEILDEIPERFYEGCNFKDLCWDKHGFKWTDDKRSMDQLVCLGMAIKRIEYCIPKEEWGLLVGGLGYLRLVHQSEELN